MNKKLSVIGLGLVLGLYLMIFPARSESSNAESSGPVELTRAVNIEEFDLSAEQKKKLEEQGFVLTKTSHKTIYEIYAENRSHGIANFITTDLVLHTTHLLYNYSLRALEYKELSQKLAQLTTEMVELTLDQYRGVESIELKDRVRLNLAFFSVARKLLDPSWTVPDPVKTVVYEELGLIESAQETGIRTSPIFDYELDYASFLPRGHYRETDQLRRYFKAVNWYGQTYFRLKPGSSSRATVKGRKETTSVLLMVKLLDDLPETFRLWQEIDDRLTDFGGLADDRQLTEYRDLAAEVFGEDINKEELKNTEKLDDFIDKVRRGETTYTLPLWAARRQVSRDLAHGFCFLSKRYDLSSDVFQSLVYPAVGSRDKPRNIPVGLDVMAAFGSTVAEEILKDRGEFDYENYGEQLASLKDKFSKTGEGGKVPRERTLKADWNEILRALLKRRVVSEKTLLGDNWDRKQLNTGLGSWTEMKHDTVLYSKRSTAMARGGVKMTDGYVEPRPEVYEEVAELTEGLLDFNILPRGLRDKLENFHSLILSLQEISQTELSGKELTDEQIETIFTAGKVLEEIITYPQYLQRKKEKDRALPRTALAVDVHQDSQSETVLQEALGNPHSVIALVKKTDSQIRLVKGGTYSYYEFTVKNEELMTDDSWARSLASSNNPPLPEWISPLFP